MRVLAGVLVGVALGLLYYAPQWALAEEPREVKTVVVNRIEGKGPAYWTRIRLEAVLRADTIRRERRETRWLRVENRRLADAGGVLWHPFERGLLCIHTHEAAWNGDNNPKYDGGLQMDDAFERTYGDWAVQAFGADAARWPVSVQLAVGIRAIVSGRGYGPWPNTRKPCGL